MKNILIGIGCLFVSAALCAQITEQQQKSLHEKMLDAAMNGKPVAVSTTKSYGCSVKY